MLMAISLFSIGQTPNLKRYSIMPVPFVVQGESLKTILEEDPDQRIAITKLKEFLVKEGYTVIDFLSKMKKAKDDQQFKGVDNQQNFKTRFIEYTGPDVYIEVEVEQIPSQYGNRVRLTLSGYLTATSVSIFNEVFVSNPFRTDDMGGLITNALEMNRAKFESSFEKGIQTIVNDGQAIQLHLSVDEYMDLSFDSEIRGKDLIGPLGDLIELWVNEHKLVAYYRVRGREDKTSIKNKEGEEIPIKISKEWVGKTLYVGIAPRS